jgi:hypothetical protein
MRLNDICWLSCLLASQCLAQDSSPTDLPTDPPTGPPTGATTVTTVQTFTASASKAPVPSIATVIPTLTAAPEALIGYTAVYTTQEEITTTKVNLQACGRSYPLMHQADCKLIGTKTLASTALFPRLTQCLAPGLHAAMGPVLSLPAARLSTTQIHLQKLTLVALPGECARLLA